MLESLVVVALFGGITAVLLLSLSSGRRTFLMSEATLYVQQEARRALDVMSQEMNRAGRIRRAGDVVGNVAFTNAAQIDFQTARSFDQGACGGICWGDETATGRWLHYVTQPTSAQNTQLLRCSTANQGDVINFSTCRVMANRVQSFSVDYVHAQRRLTLKLRTQETSGELPGGSASSSPAPLIRQVRLRNSS